MYVSTLALSPSKVAAAAFETYFPELYQYYVATIDKTVQQLDSCKRVIPDSAFPAVTFNFGKVCCFLHKDSLNYALGQCAITALGDFDPSTGGHIILEELKLVIEFPPGSTIFIPSASFTHGNIPIASYESRVSVTQYAAGSIFQWVENGYKTDTQLSPSELRVAKERKRQIWDASVQSLPRLSHFTR